MSSGVMPCSTITRARWRNYRSKAEAGHGAGDKLARRGDAAVAVRGGPSARRAPIPPGPGTSGAADADQVPGGIHRSTAVWNRARRRVGMAGGTDFPHDDGSFSGVTAGQLANGSVGKTRSIIRGRKSGRERSAPRSGTGCIQSKDLYPAATARRNVSFAMSIWTDPSLAGRPEPGAPATPPSRAWQPASWYRVSL